ncbi:PREDICTED: peroxiredoxin-2-like [Nicrophorus vespilloides]|uniref:thioredoxin-dependent peroxiredoxin n=1 Tax=Nicrophorus vespilloides TaxID=110193 RepID=A0ABM1N3X4_NICVS|nr:PREDICTED: peroxiredoxin-2-like [Nicrophorus vespilloides]
MASLIGNLLRNTPKVIRATSALKNTNVLQSFTNGVLLRNFQTGSVLGGPRVQCPAPDFKGMAVIGDEFKEIKLSDYKGKYLVLVFYPLDFTFVCPTELIAFHDRIEDFKKMNAEVIGISVDSHYTHLGWKNTKKEDGGLGPISYPLLSDLKKNIARDYEVLIEEEGIALRGLFIIDGKGILRQMTVNDLPVGRSVDETLRLIEAFQFVEKHGEVCPANWHKGSKTIKPDPKGSKEYFSSPKN